jgi:hypothetical protein
MAKSKYADIHRECKAETQNQIPDGPKINLRKIKLQINAEGWVSSKQDQSKTPYQCLPMVGYSDARMLRSWFNQKFAELNVHSVERLLRWFINVTDKLRQRWYQQKMFSIALNGLAILKFGRKKQGCVESANHESFLSCSADRGARSNRIGHTASRQRG